MGQPADDALVEGVPPWMRASLVAWVRGALFGLSRAGRWVPVEELVSKYERVRRGKTNLREAIGGGWERTVDNLYAQDVFPLLDFLVIENPYASSDLESILLESGSAWKVGSRDGFPGLERRVPLGVQEMSEHVMATSGDAGRRLSAAWHAAFGQSPNPSLAYSLAIKAVEDAAKPVVAPNDSVATLGKMIGVVRDRRGWSLPFAREDANVPTKEVVLGMMRALWAGQADRHGGNPDPALVITQEAAEAAVLLAVPLVHWFATGTVAKA